MTRDFAGAHIDPRAYERLLASCELAVTFPQSFADWSALVAEGTRLAVATNYPSDRIDVDVDEFLAWCRHVQIQAGLDALRAFLIVKRHGVDAALEGDHRA